ncbi:MAG: ammonia-forming cytochrome c nitrite reductase subunit c552 [Anaerolineae bacterium]|nr:MAG: ammonia-forming cytochrome c nitrite reductase subunit c552 [Anaerolineae bacterium]
MQRKIGLVVLILGGLLILSAVVVGASENTTTAPAPVAQTPPEGATYVGSTTCFQCHSDQYRNWDNTLHPIMIQDVAANPAANVADFSTGEEFRTLEDGSTYGIEGVTFTMGNKYRQRYIAKTDTGYVVLPGQWNIDSATWVEATPGDWLKDCAGCHTTGYSVEEQTWVELGTACEACHGPASVHVEMAKALPEGVDPVSEDVYAVRQAIVASVDSNVCAQCHTRGTSADGEHGYPVGYVVGGPLDETMFVPVAPTGAEDDANFWPDGTEKKHREQILGLNQSAHGNALASIVESDHGADYCLPCHSTDYVKQDKTFAQDVVTLENAQFSITCVQCHAPHGEAAQDNQLTEESYELCVGCHTGTGGGNNPIRVGSEVHHPMREMFEGVSFLGLDPSPSPHFANEAYGPICASCHMVGTAKSADYGDIGTHTFKAVLPTQNAEGQPDSCTQCHNPEHDPDATPESLFFYIEEVQADTQERVEDIRADLQEITDAHPEWDPQAQDKPEEQQIAERIGTLVSFVEADGSWGFHNPGYADDILSEAEDLLDELLDLLEG